jgi:nucleotide-binding universal stress UspA family protein
VTTDLVLIGFDGTEVSERAVRQAAVLFPSRPALVVTVWEAGRAFDLTVMPPGPFGLPPSPVDIRTAMEVEESLRDEAQKIAQWGAHLAQDCGLEAEGLVVADDVTVADTLVRLARERDAAVAVVGAHRHARIAELLLGSTTQGVLRDAPCPVLVVRRSAEDDA